MRTALVVDSQVDAVRQGQAEVLAGLASNLGDRTKVDTTAVRDIRGWIAIETSLGVCNAC